jgi:hypothetical protein
MHPGLVYLCERDGCAIFEILYLTFGGVLFKKKKKKAKYIFRTCYFVLQINVSQLLGSLRLEVNLRSIDCV